MMLALFGVGETVAAGVATLKITIVVFGPAPPAVLESLQQGLSRELGAQVDRGEEVPVPAGAYGPNRRQYLAEGFLPLLAPQRRSRTALALGVTAVDLYVPGLNFVFGLADPGSKSAIISLARLNPRFYGLEEDLELLQERALKEALHEAGHLLGLGHCRTPGCIMFFSNTLSDTDRKGPGFCPACRERLGWK